MIVEKSRRRDLRDIEDEWTKLLGWTCSVGQR